MGVSVIAYHVDLGYSNSGQQAWQQMQKYLTRFPESAGDWLRSPKKGRPPHILTCLCRLGTYPPFCSANRTLTPPPSPSSLSVPAAASMPGRLGNHFQLALPLWLGQFGKSLGLLSPMVLEQQPPLKDPEEAE